MYRFEQRVNRDANNAKMRFSAAGGPTEFRNFRGWKVFNIQHDLDTNEPVPALACYDCGRDLVPVESDNLEFPMYECSVHRFFQVTGAFGQMILTNLNTRNRPVVNLDDLDETEHSINDATADLQLELPVELLDNKMTKGYGEDQAGRAQELDAVLDTFMAGGSAKRAKKGGGGGGKGYSITLDIRKTTSGSLEKGLAYIRIWNSSAKDKPTSYVELREVGGNSAKLVKRLDLQYIKR